MIILLLERQGQDGLDNGQMDNWFGKTHQLPLGVQTRVFLAARQHQ